MPFKGRLIISNLLVLCRFSVVRVWSLKKGDFSRPFKTYNTMMILDKNHALANKWLSLSIANMQYKLMMAQKAAVYMEANTTAGNDLLIGSNSSRLQQ